MSTSVRTLSQLLPANESMPGSPWQVRAVQSGECLSYIAWNTETREAIAVDPKQEDREAYSRIAKELSGYRWIAILDTHTHADHISCAGDLARQVSAPLVMHEKAPSRRVDLRVSRDTRLPAQAAPVIVLNSPGHTHDSITILWGPFIFGGDTLLFGDTGRNDLPTGNPEVHYESLLKIKEAARPEMFLLPGHDHQGGRASSWAHQLQINASLTQDRATFIKEAGGFTAAAPRLLKESLFENFE